MKTLNAYLLSILGVTAIWVGAVVALEILRPDGVNTNVYFTISGICGPTLVMLIGIIRAIGSAEAAKVAAEKNEVKLDANNAMTAATTLTVNRIAEKAGVDTCLPPQDILTKSLPRPQSCSEP